MHVVVTGGAGYIGSHTCLELLNSGHRVSVIDNLSNASREALTRVEALTGKSLDFHQVDLCDLDVLRTTFERIGEAGAVIHFAGLKAVGESVAQPLRYYKNNLDSTLNLCTVMAERGLFNIVFSSSATVYGDPASVPIREDFPLSCTNPYGRTKLMTEEILQDLHRADPQWNVVLLRYFNPVGAHPSGQIGEDPNGIPNNLMPFIAQVAIGKLARLSVFGNDYPTPDGTGVRDFIHVVDLARGHLQAIEKLEEHPGVVIYNLGTGRGYSVLEMVAAFGRACGTPIPYTIVDRRPGDIAQCYADPAKALEELGWKAEFGLDEMCADSWRWQSNNPNGFHS
nr:UDP-glucose 4-epimerase GalE [uncultured Desulfobulbus sp.]